MTPAKPQPKFAVKVVDEKFLKAWWASRIKTANKVVKR